MPSSTVSVCRFTVILLSPNILKVNFFSCGEPCCLTTGKISVLLSKVYESLIKTLSCVRSFQPISSYPVSTLSRLIAVSLMLSQDDLDPTVNSGSDTVVCSTCLIVILILVFCGSSIFFATAKRTESSVNFSLSLISAPFC